MKKLKWILFLILPLVVLLATMQSGWAPGKATTNLIGLGDIFDPQADGTKYFVRLTIHHVDSQDEFLSPFDGVVEDILVAEGDNVSSGEKMVVTVAGEEILSPFDFDGHVQDIFVEEGDSVSVGQVVMTINCGLSSEPDSFNVPTKLLFFASATKGNEEITFSWEGLNVFCSKDEDSENAEFVNFGNALVERLTRVDDADGIWSLKSVSNLVGERTAVENDVVNVNSDGSLGPGFISMNLVLAVKD
jgi:hypothetical protein